MTDAVREFEQRHAFTRLAGEGDAREAEASRLPAADLATIFSELEFDRYDDFNLFARRATEISGDLGEVQQQVLLSIRGLVEESATLQQLTRSLRGEITRARLLPLTPLFIRLERQARESGMALDKPVDLVTEGGQVELDSRVVHDLADCLLHLVQNALTHGLESEAERVALGKPPRGTVRIRAEQQGARILIEVEDDGRGIDLTAARRVAVERGILSVAQAEALSEPEAIGLLFRPGFSTAATVSAAAGRGVGLDAVRAKLRGLRGEVRVATAPGQGTRFRIALPLTVAITDALMLRVGGQTFGLPLTVVREVRQIAPSDFTQEGEARYRSPEGDLQPAFRLEDLLGVESAAPKGLRPLVVVAAGDRSYGLAVDELVGKEEAVFKSMGGFLEGSGPYAGAMLTGAGEIVLILDPAMLWIFRDSAGRPATLLPAGAATSSPTVAARPRILLVDDSISVRRVVSGMLDRAGFEVATATDGVEALERLGEFPADLVLTDLEMPRLNGFELLQDIRRRSATRDLPVVILTSRSSTKHENLARQLGATRFLAKPVQEDALTTIQDALGATPLGEWSGR
jgi:chemosensory pili system protein ChpA (sensor histidine kinase/response regulator)